MISIDQTLQKIIEVIEYDGHQAYFVGGFVRDGLQGISSLDVDIATTAPLEDLQKLFKYREKYQEHPFGVAFNVDDYRIELTRMRKEQYKKSRIPDTLMWTQDIHEDALRRDFTINAFYYHPVQGLLDPLGGMEDLENTLIRFIGEPTHRIKEDPLRILRALRFQAEHGFEIEVQSLDAMRYLKDLLHDVSPAHVRKELERILMGNEGLKVALDESWCFGTLFSSLEKCIGFDQHHPFHIYDVYEHSMRVVFGLPFNRNLRLAGLFHDCAKPDVCVNEEGVYHYPNHAKASALIADTELKALGYSKKDRTWIKSLIEHHGDHLEPQIETFQMMIYEHGLDWTLDLIALKRADNLAKSERAQYQVTRCRQFLELVHTIQLNNEPTNLKDLKLNGHDLIASGVPVDQVGSVLDALMRAVINKDIQNDKQTLINYWMEDLQ